MSASRKAPETFRQDLLDLTGRLNDQAVDTLGDTRDLQLAARALAGAEAVRLARKLGPDAPRVAALRARAAARVEVARGLDVEIQIAAVRVPRVEKTDTLIHGRITDSALRGVAGAAVQLVDASGKPVGGVEKVQTDANGYYALVLKPATADLLAAQKLNVAVSTDAGEVRPTQPTVALEVGATLTHELKLDESALASLNLRRPVTGAAAAAGTPTTGTRKR